ncbi:MAG: TraR/DksA C4-type zinc finger protein [Pirellulaceae bacterium]|nr:TraR/DksA C4-type zinc finger protein [Pirellulaceae bacterium]
MNSTDLQRFRTRLLADRQRLASSIERMSEVVLTDDVPPEEHDRKVSEAATKELVLERSEEKIRRQVVDALQRLDQGTFGKCVQCGGAISGERLEAVPYTPYCIACEQAVEAG